MVPWSGSRSREDAMIQWLLRGDFVSPSIFHLVWNGWAAPCHAILGGQMTNPGISSSTERKIGGTKLLEIFWAFSNWLTMINIVRRKLLIDMIEKLSRNQVHQITVLETP